MTFLDVFGRFWTFLTILDVFGPFLTFSGGCFKKCLFGRDFNHFLDLYFDDLLFEDASPSKRARKEDSPSKRAVKWSDVGREEIGVTFYLQGEF